MVEALKVGPWEQSLFALVEEVMPGPDLLAKCKSPEHLRWVLVAQRAQERERLKLLSHLRLQGRRAQEELLRIEVTFGPDSPEEVSRWLDAAVEQPTCAMSARWLGTHDDLLRRLRHKTCASLSGWRKSVSQVVAHAAAWNQALAEFGLQQSHQVGMDGAFSLPIAHRVMLEVAQAGADRLLLCALRARRLAGPEAHDFYLAVSRTPAPGSVDAVRAELDARLAHGATSRAHTPEVAGEQAGPQ